MHPIDLREQPPQKSALTRLDQVHIILVMNKVVSIYEAKTNLSKYIKQAKSGTPVYIGGYGEQEVVLMAAKPKKAPLLFGTAAGKIKYKDEDLEGVDKEIEEMFYGGK
jgi:antitoxin (DNA-binding transcriptional repressor) of toxin-antitoxin stability system